MTRRQDEFRLSCAVADYLALALPSHVLWSHFPAGEARNQITGARLKRMGLKKGWPDYLLFHDGGVLALELKAAGGRLSDEQAAFGERLMQIGGVWRVCRSLDDVKAALASVGIAAKAVAA